MTDMTLQDAIAAVRRTGIEEQPWGADEFADLQPGLDVPVATILNAVASGDLIPKADADLAVALVVEKAAEVGAGKVTRNDEAAEVEAAIRALATADALAQVQNMQTMLDRALDQNGKLTAERDRLAARVAELEAREKALVDMPPDYGHDGLRWAIGSAMRRSIDAASPLTDRDAALYHAFRAGLRAALAQAERDALFVTANKRRTASEACAKTAEAKLAALVEAGQAVVDQDAMGEYPGRYSELRARIAHLRAALAQAGKGGEG